MAIGSSDIQRTVLRGGGGDNGFTVASLSVYQGKALLSFLNDDGSWSEKVYEGVEQIAQAFIELGQFALEPHSYFEVSMIYTTNQIEPPMKADLLARMGFVEYAWIPELFNF